MHYINIFIIICFYLISPILSQPGQPKLTKRIMSSNRSRAASCTELRATLYQLYTHGFSPNESPVFRSSPCSPVNRCCFSAANPNSIDLSKKVSSYTRTPVAQQPDSPDPLLVVDHILLVVDHMKIVIIGGPAYDPVMLG